ncbi:hypothetical protein GOODEAATRI_030833 [Goodea atripinnis]|uniref:Uncharacterized protein n=1 Tax=Goodea atripinnis TaxID=208336 RepID=A0ABV0NR62_9TELE
MYRSGTLKGSGVDMLTVCAPSLQADSPDAKDELACLEVEHQKTLREGSETSRGEGEGRVRLMEEREKRGEIIRTQREAGVGEEGLHVQVGKGELCDEDIKTKRRGEAEGGQKELEKQDEEPQMEDTGSETMKCPVEDNAEATETHPDVGSSSGPDLQLLTSRLQEVQEEADRQAKSAQDLRSKLGDQSRKTWEAEQKLVLVDAELQRLKKAGESLVEARKHIEVRNDRSVIAPKNTFINAIKSF